MKKFLISGFAAGLMLALFFISGCSDYIGSLERHERQLIDDYIKSLGDTIFELKPSGLYYIELSPGSGPFPDDDDTVSFYAKGCLLDHSVYTTNYNEPSPFLYIIGSGLKTGEVIKGVDEGLRYIKQGGISRIVLPSDLAYGSFGLGTAIPGYTPVYFEIKLVSVKPGP